LAVSNSHSKGTIAISRKLFDRDDPFFGGEPFTRREAWQWLIAEAAYKPRKVNIGNGRGATVVSLQRGQIAHSKEFMRQAWGWSSEKMVRTFLDRLEVDGRIVRPKGEPSGRPSSVITVCKYDEYQFSIAEKGEPRGSSGADHSKKTGRPSGEPKGEPSGRPSEDVSSGEIETLSEDENNEAHIRADHRAHEKGGPSTKKGRELEEGLDKKRKNTRSRASEHVGFAKWYETYPKRKARKAAARAYAKLIASGEISEADLLTKTDAFAVTWRGISLQFCPYPASWLDDGSYADEPDSPPRATEAAPAPDPATFTTGEWQSRVSLYDRGGQWSEHWGPRPGEPGCLVPAALLAIATKEPPVFSGAS
jgi:hypothetical protein